MAEGLTYRKETGFKFAMLWTMKKNLSPKQIHGSGGSDHSQLMLKQTKGQINGDFL